MSGTESEAKPVVWSIGGSHSGTGAGVQANLKAALALGVRCCTVIAAVRAQDAAQVQAIKPVSPGMLEAQLAALDGDLPPAAIKTGMLGNAANLRVVVRFIDQLRERDPALRVVVHPVLGAATDDIADAELLEALRRELLPRATLVTPNRREAAALLGLPALTTRADVEQAARALREAGAAAVVITGGTDDAFHSEDYVSAPYAQGWLTLPRVATLPRSGTGCMFASSAAAAMALGFVTVESVVLAKMVTTEVLRSKHAALRSAGPTRPREVFATVTDKLPGMSFGAPGPSVPFAPLADVRLGLYAIVDSAAWVRRVLDAGVRTVQLRIKDPAHPALREEVRAAAAAARACEAQLFINDHWRLAIEEGAYGVHLGQEDLAVADLDAIARAGLRLGVSTHALWEVCRAWQLKPSYIACGPIHPTAAKAMPWIPQGNANLAYWCSALPLPVVAIAGMDSTRAAQAMQCGAAGVAVISAITAAASPEAAIVELQRVIDAPVRARIEPPLLPQPTLRA